MSAYNQEKNTDNTILRYVIVATLAELKNKIFYYNRIDEHLLKKIEIPFYYSLTGNERFLLDNFVYDAEAEGKAIGNYEIVPRGVLQLTSVSIDSGSQTNKFVRGEFVREVDGVLKTFSLETNFLPLNMTFSTTIICSNNLEMLKATESVINKLYKTTSYSVDLGMFRIQAGLSIPEDFSQDKLFEFSLNDKKEFNITFDIEVQTFMPVFEGGILLSEIDELSRGANINAPGIGMIRSNSAGELGVYFGGIFQKFEYTVDDIRKSPAKSILSNVGYINPDDIQTGEPYLKSEIKSNDSDKESDESKDYRNAQNNKD